LQESLEIGERLRGRVTHRQPTIPRLRPPVQLPSTRNIGRVFNFDMNENSFLTHLEEHDDRAWAGVVESLAASIHDVDRNATRIWFAFYPLVLARALARAKDPQRLARRLQLQGDFRLADQIDTSHVFLYGHRYWPVVKKAVVETATRGEAGGPLAARIRETAAAAAGAAGANASLLVGVTAVA